MKIAEIRVKFGMHHGLFLAVVFGKLLAQSRSKENDNKFQA